MISWHVYPDGVHLWKDGVFMGVIPKADFWPLVYGVAAQMR